MSPQETLRRMAQAFAALGYAVKWWYKGPGLNTHGHTGPHEYNRTRPSCHARDCIRCARAALARAVQDRENQTGLAG